MCNNINWNELDHSEYFTITKDEGNEVELSLNAQQCGEGYSNLPEVLRIPDLFDEKPVTSLSPAMFANNKRIKEIKLPKDLKKIPQYFCVSATNLRAIHGTESIEEIESVAFGATRIKKALFPNLNTLGSYAFTACSYLEVADIGQVTGIEKNTFADCALLREVIWKKSEENAAEQEASGEQSNPAKYPIASMAFYHTLSLRELPLLTHFYASDDKTFLYSRINTVPASEDFRSGVKFTPCRNRVTTKLSHRNSDWDTQKLLDQDGIRTYGESCALFAVMHIHSAITGKYYSHPMEFVNELQSYIGSPACFSSAWDGNINDVKSMFDALGYQTEISSNENALNSNDYRSLVDALAHGAYIYAQVATHEDQSQTDGDHDHAVVIYGINELGEVCVLDSNNLKAPFQADSSDVDVTGFTYTIPYTNIVGPKSKFIIVYPAREESAVELTVNAVENTFNFDSKPKDYPENRVTICRVIGDTETPGSENGILTAYLVGDSAYRTFVPDTEAALYLQYKVDDNTWSENWKECNRKDFNRVDNDSINRLTSPSELPIGVTVCAVSIVDPDLPEGAMGYLTAYRLPVNTNANGSTAEIIREEWQPINSNNKYVRYPGSDGNWGNWHFFESGEYETLTESTSGESQ